MSQVTITPEEAHDILEREKEVSIADLCASIAEETEAGSFVPRLIVGGSAEVDSNGAATYDVVYTVGMPEFDCPELLFTVPGPMLTMDEASKTTAPSKFWMDRIELVRYCVLTGSWNEMVNRPVHVVPDTEDGEEGTPAFGFMLRFIDSIPIINNFCPYIAGVYEDIENVTLVQVIMSDNDLNFQHTDNEGGVFDETYRQPEFDEIDPEDVISVTMVDDYDELDLDEDDDTIVAPCRRYVKAVVPGVIDPVGNGLKDMIDEVL